MKNILNLMMCLGLVSSLMACATSNTLPLSTPSKVSLDVNLATEMQTMGSRVKQFHQATEIAVAKITLAELKVAVERSKLVLPQKIAAEDIAQSKAYQQELDALLAVIQTSDELLDQQQLAQAKDNLKALDPIKERAHKLFR